MRVSLMLGLLLVACNASAGQKVEHVCGNGPHTVKVKVEDKKVCKRPNPKLLPDDTYEMQPELCSFEPQWINEEWSDWPECPGAERTIEYSCCGSYITLTPNGDLDVR